MILYFYPKDDTPGCTKEACSFRDDFQKIKEKGAVVLGISVDRLGSHKKFSEKYLLPFPLLLRQHRVEKAIDKGEVQMKHTLHSNNQPTKTRHVMQHVFSRCIFLMLFCMVSTNAQTDFWQLSKIYSGEVHSLATNSKGHVFAATDGGGIFRSTDNGENWTQVDSGKTSARALAINSKGHIFAATDSGGIFRSTDNGRNWIEVNAGLTNYGFPINVLAINSKGHIFAGTDGDGVYRSADNGRNWTRSKIGSMIPPVQCLAINSSDHVFMGTNGDGLFRSKDNGRSWTRVNVGLTNIGYYVWSLAINSKGAYFAGTGDGIFRSTDNGETWWKVNYGLEYISPKTLAIKTRVVYSLAINSKGHLFAGTDRGVYRSTDNGGSWTELRSQMFTIVLSYYPVKSLAINSIGYLFAGNGPGLIFRSAKSITSVK